MSNRVPDFRDIFLWIDQNDNSWKCQPKFIFQLIVIMGFIGIIWWGYNQYGYRSCRDSDVIIRDINKKLLASIMIHNLLGPKAALVWATTIGGLFWCFYGQNDKLLDAKSFVDKGTACAIIVRTLT